MGATVVRYLHHDVNTVVTVQPLEAPAQQPGCRVLRPLHLQHAAGDAAGRCKDETEILPGVALLQWTAVTCPGVLPRRLVRLAAEDHHCRLWRAARHALAAAVLRRRIDQTLQPLCRRRNQDYVVCVHERRNPLAAAELWPAAALH